jgi:hypothetical protein
MAIKVKVTRVRQEVAYIDIDESDLLDPTDDEQAIARAAGIVAEATEYLSWQPELDTRDYEFQVIEQEEEVN